MVRRGGDVEVERFGEVWNHGNNAELWDWHGEAVEWVVPHSCVVDKNWEGYLGRRILAPNWTTQQPRVPVPER